jgi:hypothetical protein
MHWSFILLMAIVVVICYLIYITFPIEIPCGCDGKTDFPKLFKCKNENPEICKDIKLVNDEFHKAVNKVSSAANDAINGLPKIQVPLIPRTSAISTGMNKMAPPPIIPNIDAITFRDLNLSCDISQPINNTISAAKNITTQAVSFISPFKKCPEFSVGLGTSCISFEGVKKFADDSISVFSDKGVIYGKNLGESCVVGGDCNGFKISKTSSTIGVDCCNGICTRLKKDFAGVDYCPSVCVGKPGWKAGSCGLTDDEYNNSLIGKSCLFPTDCNLPAGIACCSGKCTKMKNDYAGIPFCPEVCIGKFGWKPGSCGLSETDYNNSLIGKSCIFPTDCNLLAGIACCTGTCKRMQTDYAGLPFCPEVCVGSFGAGPGTCGNAPSSPAGFPPNIPVDVPVNVPVASGAAKCHDPYVFESNGGNPKCVSCGNGYVRTFLTLPDAWNACQQESKVVPGVIDPFGKPKAASTFPAV